jgi:hypothetical protein
VIWGKRDRHLGAELAEPLPRWVPNVRVEWLPNATHWVQHEEAPRVNELLAEFFVPDTNPGAGEAVSGAAADNGGAGAGAAAGTD